MSSVTRTDTEAPARAADVPAATEGRRAPHRGSTIAGVRKEWVLKYSTLVVLVLMFTGFALFVDRFLTPFNLANILQQIAILGIVGAGLTFGFAAKEIDLSVGYTVGLAGVLMPLLLVQGLSLPLAMAGVLLAGLVVGLVNGLLVTLVGIPSLIATLATGSILFGMNFVLTDGRAIYGGLPDMYLRLGQGAAWGVPYLAFFMLGSVALAWFVLERTVFGRRVYAVGGNRKAAELSGVRVVFHRTAALVIVALFASVAGALLSARLGSGQPNVGERYLLDGLATVFIGMTVFRPGVATVMGTFFGALFIGVINNGLNLVGMDTFV